VIADREVAAALQQELRVANVGVPILACSMPSSGGSSRLEGVFTFLIKPVSRETLMRTVRQVPISSEELRVLVVDDDPDAVRLLQIMLESLPEPCRVSRAHDGASALESMRRERPDLVLMDLLMPNLAGDEAVRRMQADPELRTIPVAVVSASDALGPTATLGDSIGLLAPGPMDAAESLGLVRILLDRLTPQYLESSDIAPPSLEVARE
jgi:CheY-like chemotaxis protein